MRYSELKPILKEGGRVFKDQTGQHFTTRIAREAIPETIQWLEQLVGIPLADNVLGSVGKRDTSGDLDIAIDENIISKDLLVNILSNYAESIGKDPKKYVKKSGISVHFVTPIRGDPQQGYVQTDFMVGSNLDQMKFGLWSDGDKSKYSGAERNLLMSSIAKSLGDLKYSWKDGLINRSTNEVLTTHPDAIARILLGSDASRSDLDNVETIMHKLDKRRLGYLEKLIDVLLDPTDKRPIMIKRDAEEAERIRRAFIALQP